MLNACHDIVVWNRDIDPIKQIENKGAIAASSIEDLIKKLSERKVAWLTVPSDNHLMKILILCFLL